MESNGIRCFFYACEQIKGFFVFNIEIKNQK
jgi:hypothetical protein